MSLLFLTFMNTQSDMYLCTVLRVIQVILLQWLHKITESDIISLFWGSRFNVVFVGGRGDFSLDQAWCTIAKVASRRNSVFSSIALAYLIMIVLMAYLTEACETLLFLVHVVGMAKGIAAVIAFCDGSFFMTA